MNLPAINNACDTVCGCLRVEAHHESLAGRCRCPALRARGCSAWMGVFKAAKSILDNWLSDSSDRGFCVRAGVSFPEPPVPAAVFLADDGHQEIRDLGIRSNADSYDAIVPCLPSTQSHHDRSANGGHCFLHVHLAVSCTDG